MADRSLLCMKWGTLYGPDYVNVLARAARAHVTGPLRVVCMTDDSGGIDPDIETHPIPDLGYSPRHWRGGAWPKLSVFVEDLFGLKGRALFVDLDMMIVGPLDEMFEGSGMVAIGGGRDWRRGRTPANPDLLTGAFAFDLGGEAQIVEAFRADPEGAQTEFGLEQRFIERHVRAWRPWPPGWVVSFKRHLRRPVGLDLFLPPRRPPAGTRVVAFHGEPRPKALAAADARWGEFPHYGRGAVAWVRDYFEAYGGSAQGAAGGSGGYPKAAKSGA